MAYSAARHPLRAASAVAARRRAWTACLIAAAPRSSGRTLVQTRTAQAPLRLRGQWRALACAAAVRSRTIAPAAQVGGICCSGPPRSQSLQHDDLHAGHLPMHSPIAAPAPGDKLPAADTQPARPQREETLGVPSVPQRALGPPTLALPFAINTMVSGEEAAKAPATFAPQKRPPAPPPGAPPPAAEFTSTSPWARQAALFDVRGSAARGAHSRRPQGARRSAAAQARDRHKARLTTATCRGQQLPADPPALQHRPSIVARASA